MISYQRAEQTVSKLQACMTYAPNSSLFTDEFIAFLQRLVGDGDIQSSGALYTPEMRLDWLERALIQHVGKWPEEGMKEIRGVYCCKFKPADGIEVYSALSGFSPEDIEGGNQAPCLSATPHVLDLPTYLPQPGDEPVSADFMKQIEAAADAKRIK